MQRPALWGGPSHFVIVLLELNPRPCGVCGRVPKLSYLSEVSLVRYCRSRLCIGGIVKTLFGSTARWLHRVQWLFRGAALFLSFAAAVHGEVTITTVDSAGMVGEYTSLRLSASGLPIISYYDATNGNLKLAVCSDAACTTRTITTVDSLDQVGLYTSLRLNASGFAVISYFDGTNANLRLARCSNATCSSRTLTTVDGSSGSVGFYTSLSLNASGFATIAYFDSTNSNLMLARCNDATCTAPTITAVDTANSVGSYPSLQLNASGFPVISYFAITGGDLKLAVCADADCSTKTLTTVDSADNVGGFSSLQLNASGFPVISYYDISNGDLKLAVCGNPLCTTSTITSVDTVGNTGRETSLQLNASGFPVISYLDSSNRNLKLAVCGDATCTTRRLITLDSEGEVGGHSSLQLNANGDAVVSYHDATNDDLKLAILTNACRLDINDDGTRTADVDGLLILRYLLGFRGVALLAGLPTPVPGNRSTASEIEGFLATQDFNVQGLAQAATASSDGMAILRYLQNLDAATMVVGTDIAPVDAATVFNRMQRWCLGAP